MYVKRNTEAHSRNHYCHKKQYVLHISVCEGEWVLVCAFVRVALLIQHVTWHHTVICSLSGSTKFLDITSSQAKFSEKNY